MRKQSRALKREGNLPVACFSPGSKQGTTQKDRALWESREGKWAGPWVSYGGSWGQSIPSQLNFPGMQLLMHSPVELQEKKIKVVLISSNMNKKEEALPCHCITLLAYEKKERRISFNPTQEESCLFLILNSKPLHKEKEGKLALALSSHNLRHTNSAWFYQETLPTDPIPYRAEQKLSWLRHFSNARGLC